MTRTTLDTGICDSHGPTVEGCDSRSPGSICVPCTMPKGHAGPHQHKAGCSWPQAPDAAQAPGSDPLFICIPCGAPLEDGFAARRHVCPPKPDLYAQAFAHMKNIPVGGPPWPERKVGMAPELAMGFEPPALKVFSAKYVVTIEATDEAAATKLANSIGEFMMGAASAHDSEGIAAVSACGHTVEVK